MAQFKRCKDWSPSREDDDDFLAKKLFCTVRDKLFKNVSSLRQHENIHKVLKPFNCSECDKCFGQKCQLVVHRRMHHGEEKPYVCEHCGLKIATSSHYNKHLSLHRGEKPYVCDICGQAFGQSCKLTRHKRQHTREKPFKCSECDKCFTRNFQLMAHTQKHTVVLLASSHPVAFVQSKLTQENKSLASIPEDVEPPPSPAQSLE
ncbi:uncharacterized protein PEZ65_016413 [Lycodopsis pacificus]